jgi:hypothetical protein
MGCSGVFIFGAANLMASLLSTLQLISSRFTLS